MVLDCVVLQADGRQFQGLINVAGLDFEGPFYQQTRQQIRTIIRLNIEGTALTPAEAADLIKARQGTAADIEANQVAEPAK